MAGVGRELGLEGLGCDGKQHVSGCSHGPNLFHKGGIDGGERDGDIGVLCFGRWTWDKKPWGGGGWLFLLCPHTQHILVYACTTQEIGYRVCRCDVQTIGGVCLGQKQSKTRGSMC